MITVGLQYAWVDLFCEIAAQALITPSSSQRTSREVALKWFQYCSIFADWAACKKYSYWFFVGNKAVQSLHNPHTKCCLIPYDNTNIFYHVVVSIFLSIIPM